VLTATLKLHEGVTIGTIKSIAFSSDGNLLAAGFEWHIMRENVILQSVAFLPDGKLLASGSTEDIKFWDTATGVLKRTVKAADPHCGFDGGFPFLFPILQLNQNGLLPRTGVKASCRAFLPQWTSHLCTTINGLLFEAKKAYGATS
jgi:WD40 repeat protein